MLQNVTLTRNVITFDAKCNNLFDANCNNFSKQNVTSFTRNVITPFDILSMCECGETWPQQPLAKL